LEIANVTSLFSLTTNAFVIVIFGTQLHIAKIIAMYEQKDKFHSYIIWSVIDIQELSYISLQIFTYIQGHIFADFVTDEFGNNFSLFSHCNPKHIVYNIRIADVQLKNNILFLKGIAKTIFLNLNNIEIRNIIAKI